MGGRGGSSSRGSGNENTRDSFPNWQIETDKNIAIEKIMVWLDNNKEEGGNVTDPYGREANHDFVIHKDGITFYFYDSNEAAAKAAMALWGLGKLPEVLRSQIDSVTIWAGAPPPNPLTRAVVQDRQITIYDEDGLSRSEIAHELAHSLAETIYGESAPTEGSEFWEARNSLEHPPTNYATRDIGEDFAESWRIYIENKEWLMKRCPKRHKVIWKIIHYPSYKG